MDPLAKMRVKVYKLNTGSQWIDQGTGHCSCEFNQVWVMTPPLPSLLLSLFVLAPL
jgi:hypothetical protein